MLRLTTPQRELLTILTNNLCSPDEVTLTRRQLVRKVDYSLSTLQQHLMALRDKGFVSWEGSAIRSIHVNLDRIDSVHAFVGFIVPFIRRSQWWSGHPVAKPLREAFQLWKEQYDSPNTGGR